MSNGEYAKLKQSLLIDPMRLTEELVELPQVAQEAAEQAAEAQRERDTCKDALDMAEADADWRARDRLSGAGRLTEAVIKAEVVVDETVIAATTALRDAEYNLNLWKSLADGLRTKSYAIGKIADLIAAGYTTPNSIYAERRINVDRERKRLSER